MLELAPEIRDVDRRLIVAFAVEVLHKDPDHSAALVARAGRRHTDPVLVRDRLEDLLDEQPVGTLELGQKGAGIGVCHDGIVGALHAGSAGARPTDVSASRSSPALDGRTWNR